MSLSVILFIVAAVCFFLALLDWPWSGKMVAAGLLFFALAHVVAGVSLKAG